MRFYVVKAARSLLTQATLAPRDIELISGQSEAAFTLVVTIELLHTMTMLRWRTVCFLPWQTADSAFRATSATQCTRVRLCR